MDFISCFFFAPRFGGGFFSEWSMTLSALSSSKSKLIYTLFLCIAGDLKDGIDPICRSGVGVTEAKIPFECAPVGEILVVLVDEVLPYSYALPEMNTVFFLAKSIGRWFGVKNSNLRVFRARRPCEGDIVVQY